MSTRTFQPGDGYGFSFTVKSATGALADADALPTAALVHNGTTDGAVTVTVTRNGTGDYSLACTVPGGYAAGDRVSFKVLATIGGVATGEYVDHLRLVGWPNTVGQSGSLATKGDLPAVPTASVVASAIWDEPKSSHTTTGTYGALVDAAVSSRLATTSYAAAPAASAVASAVWNEPQSGHTTTGTFGVNLDAAVSTRLATSSYAAAPAASAIAAAVRDVSNASPQSNSLGAAVNAAAAIGSADGGTVSASPAPTTTTFTVTGSNLNGPAGSYVGMRWMWQTGVLPNGRSEYLISGHAVNGSAHAFTVAAMSVAPPAGDTGIIR